MFSKTPTTTDLQAQCLGNRVNNWSQIIKPLSTAQAAQLCPHQTTGKGKSLQRATCSSSHEPSPDSTISSQWVWEAAQAGSKCLTSPSLTLSLGKIKPLQSETKPDFMTITSNLPKCAPGCGQVTVADRAAVCQLTVTAAWGMNWLCIYEKTTTMVQTTFMNKWTRCTGPVPTVQQMRHSLSHSNLLSQGHIPSACKV